MDSVRAQIENATERLNLEMAVCREVGANGTASGLAEVVGILADVLARLPLEGETLKLNYPSLKYTADRVLPCQQCNTLIYKGDQVYRDNAENPGQWRHVSHGPAASQPAETRTEQALDSNEIPESAKQTLILSAAETRWQSFQDRVREWMLKCFTPVIAADCVERNYRFLEEALELVQSLGCTEAQARRLVQYVYGRDQGDVNQELGGVMVTLAALCNANGLDIEQAGEKELARVWENIEKIRMKQAGKFERGVGTGNPLP